MMHHFPFIFFQVKEKAPSAAPTSRVNVQRPITKATFLAKNEN